MINGETPPIGGEPGRGGSSSPLPANGNIEGRVVRSVESADLSDETLEALRLLFESSEPEEDKNLLNRQVSLSTEVLSPALEILQGEPSEPAEALSVLNSEETSSLSGTAIIDASIGAVQGEENALHETGALAGDGEGLGGVGERTIVLEDGSLYQGSLNLKLEPHGYGVLKFPGGVAVTGTWQNGQISEGFISYPNGDRYEGKIQNNQRHGHGVYTAVDGRVWEGDWNYGALPVGQKSTPEGDIYYGALDGNLSPSGVGVQILANGQCLSGEFKNGDLKKGVMIEADGKKTVFEHTDQGWQQLELTSETYFGGVTDGIRSGYGVLIRPDGTVFAGEWIDGDFPRGRIRFPDGSFYEGALNAKLEPRGQGVLVRFDGTIMKGSWKSGDVFEGLVVDADGARYEGTLQNNQRHGNGVVTTADGWTWKGDWKDDQLLVGQRTIPGEDTYYGMLNANLSPSGIGVQILADGVLYAGKFDDDKEELQKGLVLKPGQTPLIHEKKGRGYEQRGLFGEEYFGDSPNGVRSGYGVLVQSNGTVIAGEWVGGDLARGNVWYPNGSFYEGELNQMIPQGHGTLKFPDGIAMTGTWQNGQISEGVISHSNGDRYEGKIQNNQRHGHGVYTAADGRVWEGDWKHGTLPVGQRTIPGGDTYYGALNGNLSPSGVGVQILANGRCLSGEFKNGTLQKGAVIEADGKKTVFEHTDQGWRQSELVGEAYFGGVTNGVRSGYGVLIAANGSVCAGEWVDGDLPRGKIRFLDGSFYEGALNSNLSPQGTGARKYLSGQITEGEWDSGYFQRGRIRYSDGRDWDIICGEDHSLIWSRKRDIDGQIIEKEIRQGSVEASEKVMTPASQGVVEIKFASPHEVGEANNLEAFDFEMSGAVLNRWETPGIPTNPRLAILRLVADLESFRGTLHALETEDSGGSEEMSSMLREYAQVADEHASIMRDGYLLNGRDNWDVDQLQATQLNRPVVLYGSVPGHAISYVIYDNNLYICERSRNTLRDEGKNKPNKIPPITKISFPCEKLDVVLERLSAAFKASSLQEGCQILWGSGPDSISSKISSVDEASPLTFPEWSFDVTWQRVGNCQFFSPMTAGLCVGALLMEREQHRNQPSGDTMTAGEQKKAVLGFYKLFRKHQREKANKDWKSAASYAINSPQGFIFKTPHGVIDPETGEVSGRGFLLQNGRVVGYGEVRDGKLSNGWKFLGSGTIGLEYGDFDEDFNLHGPGRRLLYANLKSEAGKFDHGKFLPG